MKKFIKIMLLVSIFFMLNGCSAYYAGSKKKDYSPRIINNIEPKEGALLKVADGLYITNVDGKDTGSYYGSAFITFFGGDALDSIMIRPGVHTINFSRDGKIGYKNLSIKKINLKKGHQYLINFLEHNKLIKYWVKDLTTKKIIYGKKAYVHSFDKTYN